MGAGVGAGVGGVCGRECGRECESERDDVRVALRRDGEARPEMLRELLPRGDGTTPLAPQPG